MVKNSLAACTGKSPTWTSTPDYDSVNSCVVAASSEDTIDISAGTADWTSSPILTIAKGVEIIGAGVGKTIITNTKASEAIKYQPNATSVPHNYAFRISGITWDLGGTGLALTLYCEDATVYSDPAPQTKIRIDDNRFYNSTFSGAGIQSWDCRGVIDSNNFDTLDFPLRIGWGGNTSSWNTWGEYMPGTANTIYVEDNTFTLKTALTDGDEGGSYVIRYNTITTNNIDNSTPLLDMHGEHDSSQLWSTRGAEVYGNNISAGNYQTRIMSQRGGRALVFMNNDTTTSSFSAWLYNNNQCMVDPTHKVNNSYYWQNRENLTGVLTDADVLTNSGCPTDPITEGVDFWDDTTSSGVRYGTLANIPGTCTIGQGYWATNQSTTNLADMIGTNPVTPISGTLYKCTAINTWTAYYTPYTYPHPIRTDCVNYPTLCDSVPADTTPPAAPTGLNVN